MTLSGDHNEVFKSLVLQSLLLTANLRKSNRQKIFFSFSTFDFYGLIVVYTKTFSLWRRQKYQHRGYLTFKEVPLKHFEGQINKVYDKHLFKNV